MVYIKKVPGFVTVFGLITTSITLLSYAYLGTFSRYLADDYCMSGLVVQRGFWQAQIDQYTGWSNRYAGMLVLSLSDLFGLQAIRFWTGFTLLLWVLALAWVLAQVNRHLRAGLTRAMIFLLAEMIVFISLLLSPQVYQSLLWRVGAITYTLPQVFLCLQAGVILRSLVSFELGKMPWAGMAVLLGLAFFAGGFSETYLTLQMGIYVLVLVLAGIFIHGSLKRRWLELTITGLAGSLAALVVVLLAPGNAVRQAVMPDPPGILSLIKMSLGHTFLFLYKTLDGNAFQLLLAFFIPLLLVYIYFSSKAPPDWRPTHIILSLLAAGLTAVVLAAGVMLPAAYAQSSYPDGRVLVEAAFIVAALTICAGGLVGIIFAQAHQNSQDPIPVYLQLAVAAIALVMLVYPLYNTQKNIQLVPEYRAIAAVWDQRDARIRAARLNGAVEIAEKATNPPGGLGDITPNFTDWVNVCASWFYDVKTITAGK